MMTASVHMNAGNVYMCHTTKTWAADTHTHAHALDAHTAQLCTHAGNSCGCKAGTQTHRASTQHIRAI
jgi:hypothetical protein